MHMQKCGGEEKGRNTYMLSPRLTSLGRARLGDGRKCTTCARMIHRNPCQSLIDPQLYFIVYFCYESVSNSRRVFPINTCDRHRTSNNEKHETPTHLGFRLLRYCAAKSTASWSSVCTCDWESRSLKLSSSAILHQKRVNKIFGKLSSWLLNPLLHVCHTARLPLRRSRAEHHLIYHELHQSMCGLQESTIVQEDTYVLNSLIMSYILNILTCVGMILLDNL
jgi:hypothetical protein